MHNLIVKCIKKQMARAGIRGYPRNLLFSFLAAAFIIQLYTCKYVKFLQEQMNEWTKGQTDERANE